MYIPTKTLAIRGFSISFPILCLLFQFFILDMLLESSHKKLNGFRSPRSAEDFNVSLTKNSSKLYIHSKTKNKKYDFSILDTDDNDSIKKVLRDSFNTKKAFNVRCIKNIMAIYSLLPIGVEIYNLDKNISNLSDLLSAKFVYNPVSKEMLDTLIYLIIMGYLDETKCFLYRRSLVIYFFSKEVVSFDVDLEAFLGVDFSEGTNNLLAVFRTFDTTLLYNLNSQLTKTEYLSLSEFRDIFKSFLKCEKNKKIEDLIYARDFHKIPKLIEKKEIDRVLNKIKEKKVIENFKKNVWLGKIHFI